MPSLPTRSAASILRRHVKASRAWALRRDTGRTFVTLAIETSCDDTSVAIAERTSNDLSSNLKVHFHEKITADNSAYNGIHPLVALHSHQSSLAPLLQRALKSSPRPDLVAATRGPGMRSNLSVGLDTAKGLAIAWNVPFIGVHHMQAHALTPRLVSAMNGKNVITPEFPFLSILASGGHTMLINSMDLTNHTVLAETQDNALGVCLDKAARIILPPEMLRSPYGKALEDFAFPQGESDYDYTPPPRRLEELERRPTRWGWSFKVPLSESKSGQKSSRRMAYSFSGLLTNVERFMQYKVDASGQFTDEARIAADITLDERRDMARELQRVAFEHLASRIMLYLSSRERCAANAVVVSGGVASNSFLRHVLREILNVRGYEDVKLEFPPVSLCTDNALMIAWAAMEMWQAGHQASLDINPIKTWSMDPKAEDGGILGVGGWISV